MGGTKNIGDLEADWQTSVLNVINTGETSNGPPVSAGSSQGNSNLQQNVRSANVLRWIGSAKRSLLVSEAPRSSLFLHLSSCLTGVSVAYLARTTSDRQVAHGSFNQTKADQLAASAMDNIIGDLRPGIADLKALPRQPLGIHPGRPGF